MELQQLRIGNLRLIEQLELDLSPGWNLFLGANGAGKTSVLEAAFLLSHGRSFRTAVKEALIRRGSDGYSVFGEIRRQDGAVERVGISRTGSRLDARLNGDAVTAAELMRHAAVVCFEPGSHELIAGPSEERRRFLDWGVFHVEHDFLPVWRRYQRVLKQRNALLRSDPGEHALDLWDQELAEAAAPLTAMRAAYFQRFAPLAVALMSDFLGELGPATVYFQPGSNPDHSLAELLAAQRGRDIARGHTGSGPHRADWALSFANAPRKDQLSRGQEKLCAFACVMAQSQLFAQVSGEWPVLCFDDLASEVDREHQARILSAIEAYRPQVLATATHEPSSFEQLGNRITRFHVEQGRVTRLL
jgi:DNA replication and repair protein RecF